VCQYIPTELKWAWNGTPVTVTQVLDAEACTSRPLDPDGPAHRPQRQVIEFSIRCERPVSFALKLRVPWWIAGQATITINGQREQVSTAPSSFYAIQRTWHEDTVRLELPTALYTCPLPDEPETAALMEGPVVLAGLCDEPRVLYGDLDHPQGLLTPDDEREWTTWKLAYRTRGQDPGIRFVPLYEIRDEPYTVYFAFRAQ
jgi:hypothetical protein